MQEPLTVDHGGWINLSERPGMGYAPDEERLRATRIG
jgi:L-alanine-DL-glutamate epimerase-like enolase superfamily enzyme